MITREAANELRKCIAEVRCADDLLNRSFSDATNHDRATAYQELEKAVHNLAAFINNITEK